MKRLECLDGLRGVLAIYVMLSHMAPFVAAPDWVLRPLSHGMAAVDVFFILSGMVILGSFDAFDHRMAPFLVARVFRIFPVFLVVFAAAIAIQPLEVAHEMMPWIAPDSLAGRIWSDGWPADWAANIGAHLTMTHGLFPDGIWPYVYLGFLGPAWSLSAEWQFYLLAALCARQGCEWRLVVGFLGLAALAIVWRYCAPEAWLFSRAFLPNKAHYFALGMASTLLLRNGRRDHFAVVLGAVLALCWVQGGAEKLAAPLVWTVCLTAQLRQTGVLAPLAAALSSRPLLWLGAVSYCLYLVNEPVQKLLGVVLARLVAGDAGLFTVLWIPLAVLLPVAVAWWLHRAIEQPVLRWGKRRRVSASPQPARSMIADTM
jgi:peptidoglycan/LPS O-acetylase OafA/YrhL